MKAFFYKEWIKTRWFFVPITLVTLCICAYCLLNINRIIGLKGAAHIWEVVLTRDAIFIQLLTYIPLIVGILAAIMQFVPEMTQKRLKLMLHLPCNYYQSIGSMLLFGLCMLIVIFALNLLLLYIPMRGFFAPEMIQHILLTALPWYVVGCTSYSLTAWICLEPTWKRRILNIAIAIAIIRVFFLKETPQAYNDFLPILIIYTLLVSLLPFVSVARFKEGKQD